ncbi:MAG: hypothetical protein ABI758_02260 [Candidatus Woesebacteria bacterium]
MELNRQEFKRIGMNAGRGVLERTIVYTAQGLKFVILFVIDALKSVLGR